MGLAPPQAVVSPMHYTIGQLRDTVGLSLETYRHWKRALPSYARRTGRAPCFTIGDLVAASIIRRLTETAGIRVSALKDIVPDIITICDASPWSVMEGGVFAIDLLQRKCRIVRDPSPWKAGELTIFCPLDPLLAELRGALLREQGESDQSQLLFPPLVLTRAAATG